MATIHTRIYGLAMAGHSADNIVETLDQTLATVKAELKDLTSPQVTTLDQRIHDLAAAGQSLEEICYFLDQSMATVKTSLKDLTKGPSGSGGAYTGSP